MSRKNTSDVWKYFKKLSNTPNEAVCLIFSTHYKHGHGTSNLHEHLRRVHQSKLDAEKRNTELEKDLDKEQNNDQPSSSKTLSYDQEPDQEQPPTKIKKTKQLLLSKRFNEPSTKQKNDFISIIMDMIAGDLQPISYLENNGFQKMVSFLDSRYLEHIPSRRTLTRKIMPDIYQSTKVKVQQMLIESNYVAITSDIWTSLNADSFLTVTAHVYNTNYVLKTFVLTTEKLNKNHTAQYLYETLIKIFEEWKIINKVVAIVTDSGANIKAAIKKMNGIPHIPCTAHKLNLVVTNALKIQCGADESDVDNNIGWDGVNDLNILLKKCRSIVTFFKKSEIGHRCLQDKLKQLSLPDLKLKQDVSTRWNSSLLMLERLVTLKEPLTCVMMSLKDGPTMLLPMEWRIIEDIIPLLTPFNLMTTELSGEKYSTLVMVIPLLNLPYSLETLKHNPNPKTGQTA
ncbi:zinc finger BED domain-containing protein 1-like [Acyrthosiphon pisum]|uniref:Zinc finger BED domain-containing protein 1-like n=1 Tax=Acyrthosiphon pisum TaxID=7029 RepID=A0A8R1WXR7_ACYPI|nr:zinc finger BED domain-containing protein 1-like [Acyrthosiphon pisum]|eukprot:XP_008178587.1 PREDICTED: zinc finger BED domain-containing protein 1-like [Acyrthosiphon pisum]